MYKENLGLVPSSNKRPKVTDLAMVGVDSPVRQLLSNFNVGPTPAPATDLNLGLDASAIDFNSREDVEMLLNEKMKGKNKNDYKANRKTRNRAYDLLVQIGLACGDEEQSRKKENLLIFFQMITGGLAGEKPHMINAAVKGLARLQYEFSDLISAVYNLLPSSFLLLQRKNREIVPLYCVLCQNGAIESLPHLFQACPSFCIFRTGVFQKLGISFPVYSLDRLCWLLYIKENKSSKHSPLAIRLSIMAYILWIWWKARNKSRFDNSFSFNFSIEVSKVVDLIYERFSCG